MSKTYVLIHGIANVVAGGPIYDANKERYLEERGWTVNVLPTDTGEVYIEPLRKYANKCFTFIFQMPYIFSKKELEEKIDLLVSNINISDQIVIETGTDYTALWGELIARRLHAKHIVIFLDEKNSKVNMHTYAFYKFKYRRGELASISEKSLNYIFSPYFELTVPDKHILKCCCTNSVADIDSGELERGIPKGDFTIGSIGRLEKPYVNNIVKGIVEFANNHPKNKISVVFFGGSDSATVETLEAALEQERNISMVITGYIWPIPQKIFKLFDIFVSGAGSARISANQGIPTIRMDVITYKPLGVVSDVLNFRNESYGRNLSVCDYLEIILIQKRNFIIKNRQSLEEEWNWICDCFDEHMRFLEASSKTNEYYPTEELTDGSVKINIKKLLLQFIGFDQLQIIKDKFKNKNRIYNVEYKK